MIVTGFMEAPTTKCETTLLHNKIFKTTSIKIILARYRIKISPMRFLPMLKITALLLTMQRRTAIKNTIPAIQVGETMQKMLTFMFMTMDGIIIGDGT
jgi:hypothetical protein